MATSSCLDIAGTSARLADYFRLEGGAAVPAWESAVRVWHL